MSDDLCRTFWGSHGCHLPRGHVPTDRHVCGTPDDPCSEVEGDQVRYWLFDPRGAEDDPPVGLSEPYPVELYGEDVPPP